MDTWRCVSVSSVSPAAWRDVPAPSATSAQGRPPATGTLELWVVALSQLPAGWHLYPWGSSKPQMPGLDPAVRAAVQHGAVIPEPGILPGASSKGLENPLPGMKGGCGGYKA